jgi:hypothetical protein
MALKKLKNLKVGSFGNVVDVSQGIAQLWIGETVIGTTFKSGVPARMIHPRSLA